MLIQTGLSQPQASVYLYLLNNGETAPPIVAKALNMTRTNAYKVLESLDELGLATRLEVKKKFVYKAADPSALASLVAEERNRVIALEQNVREAMQELKNAYRKTSQASQLYKDTGSAAMIEAYTHQADQKEPIYFVKSRADIPFLGFETMDRIRKLPLQHGVQRSGITPDSPENPSAPEIDARSNLARTWIPTEDYTAPVEWAVSGDEVLIQIFDGEGRTIRIKDGVVAESFQQIWQLIDKNVRSNPNYTPSSPKAKRKI